MANIPTTGGAPWIGAYAEISDAQGNNYQVSLEDLAAVGIDIDKQQEITEDQMSMLLSMMNQDSLPAEEPITISIQSDGGIKLFSPSQLAEINIDTQNLTDEDIRRIVEMAAVAAN